MVSEELSKEVEELRKPYEGIKGVHNIWKPVGNRKYEDLTGKVFGRLTAMEPVGRSKRGNLLWLCRCKCGNNIITKACNLKVEHTLSCGCLNKERIHKRRSESLEGKTFGNWTVIDDSLGKKCLCKCKCGTIKEVNRDTLKRGESKSCGCYQKEKGFKDTSEKMVGKKFGRLTVIKRVKNKGNKAYFLCKCDCGNEKIVRGSHLKSGLISSCGCYNKERIHEANFKSLVGQRVGRLTVMEIAGHDAKSHNTLYKCKCDCGNEVVFKSSQLQGKKRTESCGCLHRDRMTELKLQDLTGMKFGRLTVIRRCENTAGGETRYLCKCDCGGEALVTAPNLKAHQTISCGCIKSKGEYKIAKILTENNISFQKQKTFEDLKRCSKGVFKFDFYVYDGNYIIEYDGIQHFKSGKGWDTEEHVQRTKERDIIKNDYCREKGIPLIRIPYTHFEHLCIDDLKLETTNFLINKD